MFSEEVSDIPVFVLDQLKLVAEKCSFVNFSIEKQSASDGFISSLSRYKILGQRKENEDIISDEMSVICKTLPTNENRIRMFNNIEVFEREIYFYNKIKPIFETFQKERLSNVDQDGFVAYPKCYVATRIDNQFVIILEDLRTSGYQPWNRENKVDFDTVSIIMRELELRENYLNLMEDLLKKNAAAECGVIGHGDFYENNILFRLNENVVSSVNILDFQLCRMGSPALDISYYLLTSTNSNIRRKYDQLLQIYHESLSTLLLKLGSDPRELFTFEDLADQMKKFGKYGLVFIPFLLQITLSKPDDIINLDMIEREEDMLDLIKLDDKTRQIYKEGLDSAISDAIKFEWV